jgi:hypothetical protein
MIDAIVAKMKGFILNPVETFKASRDDASNTVFTYFGVILLVYAIMSAIIAAIAVTALGALGMFSQMMPGITAGFAMLMPLVVFFWVIVSGIIGTIIFGAWTHLWVYIFGGRNGIMQTMKAIAYGMTPAFLLGWIPLVGIVFAVWAFILDIFGIRELAGISTGKAVIAMIIAVIIPLLIMALIMFVYIAPLMMSSYAPGIPRTGY